jgi:hypothetical protein
MRREIDIPGQVQSLRVQTGDGSEYVVLGPGLTEELELSPGWNTIEMIGADGDSVKTRNIQVGWV